MMMMKNWMIDTATILFDDSKNDFRSLPKTVRFQILVTLSFVWSTAFTLYFIGQIWFHTGIWTGLVLGHIAIIMAMYYTFKQFHNVKERVYDFGRYHSVGRQRGYTWGRDKFGNPFKIKLDKNDPGGEHE